jgi:hypothetical protein
MSKVTIEDVEISEIQEMQRVAVLQFIESQQAASDAGLALKVENSAFRVGNPAEGLENYKTYKTLELVNTFIDGYNSGKDRALRESAHIPTEDN